MKSETNGIYIETPLIYSKAMSDIVQRDVYLKLENVQPSGSFKLRGMSGLCKQKYEEGYTRFVGSSGGNAGLGMAYASNALKVPCKIYVPVYVSERLIKKLKSYGAEVEIHGNDWFEANEKATKDVENNAGSFLIHPFDHETVWATNGTLVPEIKSQLNGKTPSCIAVSVGGGGLLAGILLAMEEIGWGDIPVLAIETKGADSLNASVKENKLVTIELDSIAKTLAIRQIAPRIFDMLPRFNIISHVLPDKWAVKGCIGLLDDHGFLVEPSCGVTMAAAYARVLPDVIEEAGFDTTTGPIVLIACGGSDITPKMIEDYTRRFDIYPKIEK